MAGNVWEWCHSLYRPYPYRAGDGHEDLVAGGSWRVLRGGSFLENQEYVRCAYRDGSNPDPLLSFYYGFRIARGPLPRAP